MLLAVISDVVWQALIAAVLALGLAWIGYKVQTISKSTDAVHTLVNSNMGVQLEISEIALGRLAKLPGASKEDIAAWEKARNLLAAHVANQAIVDSKS